MEGIQKSKLNVQFPMLNFQSMTQYFNVQTCLSIDEVIFWKIKLSSWHSFHNVRISPFFPGTAPASMRSQCLVSWVSFLQMKILLRKSFLELAQLASM